MAVKADELVTARQAGEMMDLPHKEVIRRIRKNHIEAQKLGWIYVIQKSAIEKAMRSDWYQRLHKNNE